MFSYNIILFSFAGATLLCCAFYGRGTGSIVLRNLGCLGVEESWFDCPHTGTNYCNHNEDVSVSCQGMKYSCCEIAIFVVDTKE